MANDYRDRGYGRDTGYWRGDYYEPRPSYRGRGPKNYQRSDERIREDVCERLEQDDYIDATDIEVRVANGIVTLTGTVEDRMTKRRTEDVVESIRGVQDVENQLRIGRQQT